MDRYPIGVEKKGGFTWWNPSKIFITTNYHPKEWYDIKNRQESYKALIRRFHYFIGWDKAHNEFKNYPLVDQLPIDDISHLQTNQEIYTGYN